MKRGVKPQLPMRFIALIALALLVPLIVACGGSTEALAGPRDLQQPAPYGGAYARGSATGDTQAGAAFARWVLDQDPGQQYMTDAVVRNESSLGVKVQPTISRADTQRLLVSLTEGMARTFPGGSITVVAFYQSGDKLAESHYDPRTGQIDFNFVQ